MPQHRGHNADHEDHDALIMGDSWQVARAADDQAGLLFSRVRASIARTVTGHDHRPTPSPPQDVFGRTKPTALANEPAPALREFNAYAADC